jgi:ABC-type nitrate/sulfonate/bicarbonate transport system permease component
MTSATATSLDRSLGAVRGPQTGRIRAQLGRWLIPASGLAVVAVLWQLATVSGLVPSTVAPTFTATLSDLGTLLGDGAFWRQVWATLRSWALGLGLSILIAIPLGVLLGTTHRAYGFFRLPIESLRPIPPVVILPLALLLLGGDLLFKVVLITQGVVWPLMVQTVYGIRTTDPVTLDTATVFRIGRWRRIALFRLPAAAPMIATGLRLAAASAFAVAIVTELVGGATGLGQILIFAQSANDMTRVYSVTIFTGLAGVLITGIFVALERVLLRWAPKGGRA